MEDVTFRADRRQVDIDKRIKRDSDRLSALYKVCCKPLGGAGLTPMVYASWGHGKFMYQDMIQPKLDDGNMRFCKGTSWR